VTNKFKHTAANTSKYKAKYIYSPQTHKQLRLDQPAYRLGVRECLRRQGGTRASRNKVQLTDQFDET